MGPQRGSGRQRPCQPKPGIEPQRGSESPLPLFGERLLQPNKSDPEGRGNAPSGSIHKTDKPKTYGLSGRETAPTRPALSPHGAHLGRKLILRPPQGRSADRQGQDDHLRRIQRHPFGIREHLRGRNRKNQILRPPRRGKRHHEGRQVRQQLRRFDPLHHRRTLHRVFEAHHPGRKLIIQAGIRRVVYSDDYRSEEGLDLLRRVGIECVQYKSDELG